MNVHTIAAAEPSELPSIYQQLMVDRMKLDRWFTQFLDEHGDMDSDDPTTPDWKVYHMMLDRYTEVNQLITTATYYLQKNHGRIAATV